MSLRAMAEADLGVIVEDGTTGFGWPIEVTAPSGAVATLTGLSDDIGLTIDPDTGQPVSGRLASVAIRISTLMSFPGMSMPREIPDEAGKPWLVRFNDINGKPWTFKVKETMPDRAIGNLVCLLELYK